MDIIFDIHKSVEQLFQILGLIELWTHRSMELSLIEVAIDDLFNTLWMEEGDKISEYSIPASHFLALQERGLPKKGS
jgi:hypothetical protein